MEIYRGDLVERTRLIMAACSALPMSSPRGLYTPQTRSNGAVFTTASFQHRGVFMSLPKIVLDLPPIFGDNAAELEGEIIRLARGFFGPDAELALPTEYQALLVDERFYTTKKTYVVTDLSVSRRVSGQEDRTLKRSVELPGIQANTATEFEHTLQRLVAEFFGSNVEVETSSTEYGVMTSLEDSDEGKYESEDMTVWQTGVWP